MTIFNISFCLKSSPYQLSFGWSFPAIEKFSFFLFYNGNTMSFLYILIFDNKFTFGLIPSSSFGLYAKSSSKCSSGLVFISCSPVLSIVNASLLIRYLSGLPETAGKFRESSKCVDK